MVASVARFAVGVHDFLTAAGELHDHEVGACAEGTSEVGGPGGRGEFGVGETGDFVVELAESDVVYLAFGIETGVDFLHDHPFDGVLEKLFWLGAGQATDDQRHKIIRVKDGFADDGIRVVVDESFILLIFLELEVTVSEKLARAMCHK
jgi:hypothetical protein